VSHTGEITESDSRELSMVCAKLAEKYDVVRIFVQREDSDVIHVTNVGSGNVLAMVTQVEYWVRAFRDGLMSDDDGVEEEDDNE